MSYAHDPDLDRRGADEVERLKAEVSCAVVLERARPPWRLDTRESSRDCLKYRRGKGEIVIVNHGQKGWWDPGDARAKGDVFSLVQYLEPGLNFGQARRVLRDLAGVTPAFPAATLRRRAERPLVPPAGRWAQQASPVPGDAVWRYLNGARGLPAAILKTAVAGDAVRAGPRGTAWFAHRDHDGVLTGIEMRGPSFRGFSTGDIKSLFRLPCAPGPLPRVVVHEAPIDALSLAALEGRRDTLHVATAGGMGPGTIEALERLLQDLAHQPDARLVAATDADVLGDRHALTLHTLAEAAGVPWRRLRPHGGKDWNNVLASCPRPSISAA
ncbi:DUF3991 domain-containing protein [Marinivivus vitaminiproducens]|uniref:DUF3991 domain-containing protein n=1 Tax=Marinivivus vitaminiproducens TaxID=3035935 RepID=UPI00279F9EBE|nr:DUF3991 and TOPRIM domain-containing protein [Geminicoccaceae bacterium SCSIO 64248]